MLPKPGVGYALHRFSEFDDFSGAEVLVRAVTPYPWDGFKDGREFIAGEGEEMGFLPAKYVQTAGAAQ